jgi:hypothetical protein
MSRRAALATILVLGLALRLYHLQSPLIGFGSWRQCDTAAMARNFQAYGHHLLYPQIDWAGDGPGYVETEFPIYPYMVSGLYAVFGVHDWFGRLVSIAMSMLGVLGIYLLVKEEIDGRTALWAAGILAVLPLSVYYGRTFMNEPMLLMCSVFGLYFFSKWMTSRLVWQGAASAVFIALAILIKLPTLYLGLPLLYLALSKRGARGLASPGLWLYAVAILVPVGLWYYHAHQTALRYGVTFGIWEYKNDKWGNWWMLAKLDFWNHVLFASIAERHLAWFGLPILVGGLILKRQRASERLFDVWMVALLVYLVVVAKGNYVHEYYQLPFLLPIAVFIAKVLARCSSFPLVSRWQTVAVAALSVGLVGYGGWRYVRYMRMENANSSPELALARLVQSGTENGTLVVAVDDYNPTLLYLFDRKGWHAKPEELASDFLADKVSHGAKYLAGLHRSFADDNARTRLRELFSRSSQVVDDGQGFVVRLAPPRSP